MLVPKYLMTTVWREYGSLLTLLAANSIYPVTFEHPPPILRPDPCESKKTLGVHDCLTGGNKSNMKHIRDKINPWISKM